MNVFLSSKFVILALAILGVNRLGLRASSRFIFVEEHSPALFCFRCVVPDDNRGQEILAARERRLGTANLQVRVVVPGDWIRTKGSFRDGFPFGDIFVRGASQIGRA